MATINATVTTITSGVLYSWHLDQGDVGDAAEIYAYPSITVQTNGNTTNIALEGSNNLANWNTVMSVGSAVLVDAPSIRPRYLRPNNTSAATTDVYLVAHKMFAGI